MAVEDKSTSQFDQSLKNITYVFTLTGLSLESRKRSTKDTIKCRFIYIFNFIWLNSDIVGAVQWFMEGVQNGKSVTELTYLFPCTMLSFLATMKSLIHIRKEDTINQVIEDIRTLEIKSKDKRNNEIDKIIKKEIRFLNIVVTVLNILNFMMVIVFTVSPLVLIALKYIKTKKFELMLPFLDVYPFDPLDIRYWPFVYIKQIWSECIVLFEICASDYLYYTCCTYIRIQFQLLRQEIEDMVPSRNLSSGLIQNDERLRSKLVDLIKWHQQLISSADMLEVIYTKSTLFNFLSSSVIICLTGFNVTTISDIAFIVTFLTFLFMSLLQIYFLCFFGDLLMRSSWEVNDAVCNCRWYVTDTAFRKDLLLVQIRSQKPCKLTASGFADVNLRAFMRVSIIMENIVLQLNVTAPKSVKCKATFPRAREVLQEITDSVSDSNL